MTMTITNYNIQLGTIYYNLSTIILIIAIENISHNVRNYIHSVKNKTDIIFIHFTYIL